jgi:hypothetical protein
MKICKVYSPAIFFLIFAAWCAMPVLADEQSAAVSVGAPQAETDFIGIFTAARKDYMASRAPTRAQDGRLQVQVRLLRFMQTGQKAEGWTGTVRSRGLTPEGDAWISIEVGDGVTLSTWQSEADDGRAGTLILPGSKLFAIAQTAQIGQSIRFSGNFLTFLLAQDEDMILRPRFIMSFSELNMT